MVIFNIQPIKVNECVFNKEYIGLSQIGGNYESGFDYEFEPSSPKTFTIIFELLYTVDNNYSETLNPISNINEFSVEIGGEAESDKILFSYNYSCEFNFKNEGFDSDVSSLREFLEDFYMHIKNYISKPGFEIIEEKERQLREYNTLEDTVLEIIENLRANGMYEF
ncbi:hypothetical protein [Pedobacter sp. SG908]|uniref:hypothetical protein n=1 Tax=Pedobacter sp. SG908 TaxID=2587135 RepID=UPI00141E08E6|nr:hypothetical protein [Pedobacter sp. SG908]NII83195.1 hypothetical protein [Pedobacter sp. SG908]